MSGEDDCSSWRVTLSFCGIVDVSSVDYRMYLDPKKLSAQVSQRNAQMMKITKIKWFFAKTFHVVLCFPNSESANQHGTEEAL